MFEINDLQNGIIQIVHEGYFTLEHWIEYKHLMMHMLDDADSTLYVLSDFSRTERFDKRVILEAGTAPHLTHEKLGLIVLYGGTELNNFILQITQNRAQREHRDSKLRIYNDYDRALEMLLKYCGNGNQSMTV